MSLWLLTGIYVDGWAHNHDVGVETFFTPWHLPLYSGFAVTALAIIAAVAINKMRGHDRQRSIPSGYGLGLLGVFIFGAGGGLDMIWHIVFGVEKDVQALLSPTHLMLALGAILMVSSPLRAAWRRPGTPKGLKQWLPVVLSMTFTLGIIAFMTQFAHPFRAEAAGVPPTDDTLDFYKQANGISGILLQAAFSMGIVLLTLVRWQLPMGSLTLYYGATALAMSYMKDQQRLIFPALLAGIVADILLKKLRPSPANARSLRIFAFTVPAVYFILYFADLMITGGIWWTVHFWTGAIVLPGAIAWLMTYLLVPPKVPTSSA